MAYWYDALLKNDLSTFIGKTLHTVNPGATYLPNWHIDLIAEYLEAARRREITRLIINMPPRSLKSICVSVAWPAWLLGHNPNCRIVAASYASSLSLKHSLDCRLVVESPWYQNIFPETILARDQNEKQKFMTTERGHRIATSVGGSITGEGGDFLILDDPQSPLQAMRQTSQEHVNQWFGHTFASRLDDKQKGVIILVMQRLHANDLTGYLLLQGGWTHLCLPAVARESELYSFGRVKKNREAEELLHPERETALLMERAKHELGSSAFAAQYQQNPIAEEGAMVRLDWFGRYGIAPVSFDRCVQSWDTAIKSGDKHDASVCLTFVEYQNRSYLVDVRVMRHEYPDLKRTVYAIAEQWHPQAILMEDRASGQQLIQDIRRESSLPIIAISPKNDKVTRFAAVSAMIEAGKVVLPEQSKWLTDFECEVFSFPKATHDDQVDALSQYLDWLKSSLSERFQIRRI